MVSTDASGKGSRIYGKTSNHVLGLKVVFADGSAWQSVPLDTTALTELKSGDDLVNQIYQGVDRIVTSKHELITQRFPKGPLKFLFPERPFLYFLIHRHSERSNAIQRAWLRASSLVGDNAPT
jgi:hypothetical protein